MRACRIGPCVGKALEARALVRNLCQDVEQVAGRAREPVEPRDEQHVPRLKDRQGPRQRVAISRARAADLLCENLRRAGLAQGRLLAGERLAVRRDPGIAEDGHFALQFCAYLSHSVSP